MAKPDPETRASAADHDLMDGLFQLSFLLQTRLTRIATAHDLSLVQVRLLGILRDREPGMLELAGYLDLEKSSVSGLVARAEARGLLERVPSTDDRRAATIRVTARGKRLTRTVADAVRAEVEAVVAPLSTTEQDRLAKLVWRVLASDGG